MSIPETVSKFLEGNVIVDRPNPFKDDDGTYDNGNSNPPKRSISKTHLEKNNSKLPIKNGKDTENQDCSNLPKEKRKQSKALHENKVSGENKCIEYKEISEFENQSLIVETKSRNSTISSNTLQQEEIQKIVSKNSTSDAYASLIKILAMDEKNEKRSSFKKIFPSIFNSVSKQKKKSRDVSDTEKPNIIESYSKTSSDSIITGKKSSLHKRKADNTSDVKDNIYDISSDERHKHNIKTDRLILDNSPTSSSSSTLVSESIYANDTSSPNDIIEKVFQMEVHNIITCNPHEENKNNNESNKKSNDDHLNFLEGNNQIGIIINTKHDCSVTENKGIDNTNFSESYKENLTLSPMKNENFKPITIKKSIVLANPSQSTILIQRSNKIYESKIPHDENNCMKYIKPEIETENNEEVVELRNKQISSVYKLNDTMQNKDNALKINCNKDIINIDNGDKISTNVKTNIHETQSDLKKMESPIPSKRNLNQAKAFTDTKGEPAIDYNFASKEKHVSAIELDYEQFAKNVDPKTEIATSSPVKRNQRILPRVFPRSNALYEVKNDSEQKNKNLQNVEAFYWHQLKKMKDKQEQELIRQNFASNNDITGTKEAVQNIPNSNCAVQYTLPWRCRSVSPGFARNSEQHTNQMYAMEVAKSSKPPIVSPKPGMVNSYFVRGIPTRYTIGSTSGVEIRRKQYNTKNNLPMNNIGRHSLQNYKVPVYGHLNSNTLQRQRANSDYQRILDSGESIPAPIFKKGSLYSEPVKDMNLKEKRVSFSKSQRLDSTKLNSVYENVSSVHTNDNIVNRFSFQGKKLKNSQIPQETVNNIRFENMYGKINDKRLSDDLYATVEPANKSKYVKPIANSRDLAVRFDDLAKDNKLNSAARVAADLYIRRISHSGNRNPSGASESESGSEAGEVQRIMLGGQRSSGSNPSVLYYEEEWNSDGKNRGDGSVGSEGGRGRITRRDDPRRHTLGGDLLRAVPPHSALVRGMDIEPPLPRGYPPPSSAMLFDDDPGIMSEVETASTGFRRGGKQRSSLPVVRTPSKTLERPLGLVFLQYRSETKRALLPNEITSIDTVKALFVRSFPKQLTMEYLDSPLVKIYIHDSSKDMFYELEDLRSHLRDIRDRSVLRLFESADVSGGAFPGSLGSAVGLPPPSSGPLSWDQDQSYFSEPEFDSDYHHQHIHKSKSNSKAPAYYMGTAGPNSLPRGGSVIRAYSPATGGPIPADRIKTIPGAPGAPPKPLRAYGSTTSVIRGGSERCFPFSTSVDTMRASDQLYSLPADRIHNEGYMSSPERGSRGAYEEPYYTQYVGPARSGMTPVIDEESGDPTMLDDQYSLYSMKIPGAPRPAVRGPPYDTARLNAHSEDLQQRMRVEHMERQLANLTGLVQKALQAPVVPPPQSSDFLSSATHFRTVSQESVDPFLRNERPPKLGKGRYHKSVSFEKSVSFSDEPPDMNSPKQHSPQHSADTKPPKPAIKSSTLPRMSSQERDRLKPVPPPKPKALVGGPSMTPGQPMSLQSVDYQNYLKGLQKKCKELRMDMRNLRRMTQSQAHTVREMICDTFIKFRTATSGGGDFNFHEDSMRLAREEEIYKQEMLKLEADLSDLENTVEQLRGSVINRKTRVNMLDVERMALILSKSSKTVADLKVRFPSLHDGMKGMLSNEMEKVVREEKFLKEEPERLELALRRCKKLTGTLVTLKRLASVQEQRLPCDGGRISPGLTGMEDMPENSAHSKVRGMGEPGGMAHPGGGSVTSDAAQRTENALDALLDELQTFARPAEGMGDNGGVDDEGEGGLLRRLGSPEPRPAVVPRGQSAAGKPPVPERNPELLQLAGRRAPPPPPPRTSSRSPLASPAAPHPPPHPLSASNSSSCDSVDSQERARAPRHDLLEQRHQELLRKQKALQEQYARLQQIQRGGNALAVVPPPDLKKTGSESNLATELTLSVAAPMSASLTHLAHPTSLTSAPSNELPAATTSKIYETDIL